MSVDGHLKLKEPHQIYIYSRPLEQKESGGQRAFVCACVRIIRKVVARSTQPRPIAQRNIQSKPARATLRVLVVAREKVRYERAT